MDEAVITLTMHELDQIMKLLMKRPFHEVDGLIHKIINQVNSKPPKASE